jgi:ribosomal protein S18 acetylase RimI-like enzyme
MKIRPLQIQDSLELGRCVGDICEEGIYMVAQHRLDEDIYRRWIFNMISRGNPFLVLEDAGKIVGWIEVRRDTESGRKHNGLLSMGMLPAYREKGWGKKLLQEAINLSFSTDFLRIELWVRGNNTNALMLYHKMGFVMEGTRRNVTLLDDGTYENEHLMSLLKVAAT